MHSYAQKKRQKPQKISEALRLGSLPLPDFSPCATKVAACAPSLILSVDLHIVKVEPDRFTIHTRRREEPNGAWKPDSRWTQGAGKGSLDYYVIERSPVPTLTSPITSTSREAEKNEPRGATNINMHFHNKVYGVAGNIEGNLEIPPSASNSDTTDS